MQLIIVGDGLIYIRPYYVSVPQNSGDVDEVTEFRSVIVSYNDRSVLEPTIGEALARLFPGFEGDVGDLVEDPAEPSPDDPDPEATTEDEPDSEVVIVSGDAAALLEQADILFIEADQALADGDLGTYQSKIDEARALIEEAVAILEDS